MGDQSPHGSLHSPASVTQGEMLARWGSGRRLRSPSPAGNAGMSPRTSQLGSPAGGYNRSEAFYTQRRVRTGLGGSKPQMHGGAVEDGGSSIMLAPGLLSHSDVQGMTGISGSGKRMRSGSPTANPIVESVVSNPYNPHETRRSPVTVFASPRRLRHHDSCPPDNMGLVFSDNTGKEYRNEIFGSHREGKRNHAIGFHVAGNGMVQPLPHGGSKQSMSSTAIRGLGGGALPSNVNGSVDNPRATGGPMRPELPQEAPGPNRPSHNEHHARTGPFGTSRRFRSGSPTDRENPIAAIGTDPDVKWPWGTKGTSNIEAQTQVEIFGTRNTIANRPASPQSLRFSNMAPGAGGFGSPRVKQTSRVDPTAGQTQSPVDGVFHSDRRGKGVGLVPLSQMRSLLR